MKKLFVLSVIFILVAPLGATTIIVDQNGGGQFTTIQAAINAASSGDTVKVWPGTYSSEQVNLNKNITLMGSGYENTIITGGFNPTVLMSSGKFQWFMISSSGGRGIVLSGGIVKNCVIVGTSTQGIFGQSGSSTVTNCVIHQSGSNGIETATSATINVINCISRLNGNYGYAGYNGTLNLSYSNILTVIKVALIATLPSQIHL